MYFPFDQLQNKSFFQKVLLLVLKHFYHSKAVPFSEILPVKSFSVFDFNQTAWKIDLKIECGDIEKNIYRIK